MVAKVTYSVFVWMQLKSELFKCLSDFSIVSVSLYGQEFVEIGLGRDSQKQSTETGDQPRLHHHNLP